LHSATRVRTWRVARLYSETALSREPFGIGHMYIYSFMLRMTDNMSSQNIGISSWDVLYKYACVYPIVSTSVPCNLVAFEACPSADVASHAHVMATHSGNYISCYAVSFPRAFCHISD
jgi:hypothetical protein